MKTLVATCLSFNRLPSILEKSHGVKNYYAYVSALDFFDLDGWDKTNVRDPKPTGRVPKRIWESLNSKHLFPLINRGIILSAKEVRFNNQNNSIEIDLENPGLHGLLDGGHTYLQIKKLKENCEENQIENQFIKVEIITGLDSDQVVDIADGRNTSNQVKDVSLEELQGLFEDIKKALKGQPYENDIAYKEYETCDGDPTKPKLISVTEILKCIACLDRVNFNDEKHPANIVTRGGDTETIKHYREHREALLPLLALLPDALVLWDTIKEKIGDVYNAAGGNLGLLGEEGNRFFKKGKPKPLPFKKHARYVYSFTDSLRLPIFAAFRAAITQDRKTGKFRWKDDIDPSGFFMEHIGGKLTRVVCESLKVTQEPTKTARTESVWESCYDKLRLTLAELREPHLVGK